jgi:hypothetical protein
VTVSESGVAAVTLALRSPKKTAFPLGREEKFDPAIFTDDPTKATLGTRESITGTCPTAREGIASRARAVAARHVLMMTIPTADNDEETSAKRLRMAL